MSTLSTPYNGRLKITIEALDASPEEAEKINKSFEFQQSDNNAYRLGEYHHHIPILGGPEYGNMIVDAKYTGTTIVISNIAPMVDVALRALKGAQDNVKFSR